jgi:hypothetical protein
VRLPRLVVCAEYGVEWTFVFGPAPVIQRGGNPGYDRSVRVEVGRTTPWTGLCQSALRRGARHYSRLVDHDGRCQGWFGRLMMVASGILRQRGRDAWELHRGLAGSGGVGERGADGRGSTVGVGQCRLPRC